MSNRLASSLGTTGSSMKTRRFRTFDADGVEQFYDVPLFLPNINSIAQDYSTTGNVTFDPGIYYFKDFDINSGHQLTLSSGITIIYCAGTFTCGGNGITGVLGTDVNVINLRNYAVNQNIAHGSGGANGVTNGNNGSDATGLSASGGGGGGTDGIARLGGDGGGGSYTHGGGGGGCGNDVSGNAGGNGNTYGLGRGGNGGNGGPGGTAGTFGGNSQSSLFIIANSISISADINLSGGAGGNGGNGTSGGGGGGGGNGGNGGVIGLFSKSIIQTSGNITVNGGAGGNGGNGSNGNSNEGSGGGGGGAAGGDAGILIMQGKTMTLSGGTRASSAGTGGTGGTGGVVSTEIGGNGGAGAAGFIDTNNLLNLQVITGDPF